MPSNEKCMTGQKPHKQMTGWMFALKNENYVGHPYTTSFKNICSLKLFFHEN